MKHVKIIKQTRPVVRDIVTVDRIDDAEKYIGEGESAWFKDSEAPKVRDGVLTPIADYHHTTDGWTILNSSSIEAWRKTAK
jgi:hypothetical protein